MLLFTDAAVRELSDHDLIRSWQEAKSKLDEAEAKSELTTRQKTEQFFIGKLQQLSRA